MLRGTPRPVHVNKFDGNRPEYERRENTRVRAGVRRFARVPRGGVAALDLGTLARPSGAKVAEGGQ